MATVGRVGRRMGPGRVGVRVDRGVSALGNPYVVREEGERRAACDAYRTLLRVTVDSSDPREEWYGAKWVRQIGEQRGFTGEVGRWHWAGARAELAWMHRMMRRCRLELRCHCAPRVCHAESVAAELARMERASPGTGSSWT